MLGGMPTGEPSPLAKRILSSPHRRISCLPKHYCMPSQFCMTRLGEHKGGNTIVYSAVLAMVSLLDLLFHWLKGLKTCPQTHAHYHMAFFVHRLVHGLLLQRDSPRSTHVGLGNMKIGIWMRIRISAPLFLAILVLIIRWMRMISLLIMCRAQVTSPSLHIRKTMKAVPSSHLRLSLFAVMQII